MRERLGVVGAGTMGSGIGTAAALAGWTVVIVEPDATARARSSEKIAAELDRGARRGRWKKGKAEEARKAIEIVPAMQALASCELVVEAVSEELDLKRDVLRQVEAELRAEAILASNTSSLSIAGLSGALSRPERFAGMHFFNPAAVLPLVELVPTEATLPEVLKRLDVIASAWGKTTVVVSDTPGFVVNRCVRPYYNEPDRLLQEGIADIETIDELCRSCGFPMGPFELIDLIGLDVNLEIQRSFWEQSFGEPRWRPSRSQSQLVKAGRLGRKTSQGFYSYPREATAAALASKPGVKAPPVFVYGETPIAAALRKRFRAQGVDPQAAEAEVQINASPDPAAPTDRLAVGLCWRDALSARSGEAVGFSCVPPLGPDLVVELVASPGISGQDLDRVRALFLAGGMQPVVVNDGPGLVRIRILAQLINEAFFAVQEGVASESEIDKALILALGHPRGPFKWAGEIGLLNVLGILDGLQEETGDDRYRAAPLLRRRAREISSGGAP